MSYYTLKNTSPKNYSERFCSAVATSKNHALCIFGEMLGTRLKWANQDMTFPPYWLDEWEQSRDPETSGHWFERKFPVTTDNEICTNE